jgi:hypothetical protein
MFLTRFSSIFAGRKRRICPQNKDSIEKQTLLPFWDGATNRLPSVQDFSRSMNRYQQLFFCMSARRTNALL